MPQAYIIYLYIYFTELPPRPESKVQHFFSEFSFNQDGYSIKNILTPYLLNFVSLFKQKFQANHNTIFQHTNFVNNTTNFHVTNVHWDVRTMLSIKNLLKLSIKICYLFLHWKIMSLMIKRTKAFKWFIFSMYDNFSYQLRLTRESCVIMVKCIW